MPRYRDQLPQADGGLFVTDAGCETDLIFNKGIEIREFAAHTLLEEPAGRQALADYYRGFLSLGHRYRTGMVLDCPTWKAHPFWAADLGTDDAGLAAANRGAVAFACGLREEYTGMTGPVVVNALVGPRGDAYAPEEGVAADEAESYHATQLSWLADTEVDMVTALTFTQSGEAIGVTRAARAAGLPIVVSFTVETDGTLPTGEALGDAIDAVEQATDGTPAYYMINCAHPDHFIGVIDSDAPWASRVQGLRCNASRKSHAELDAAEVLDDGNPIEFAKGYQALAERLPGLNVLGGCCGSDLRHVTGVVEVFA
jgi:S-methylmethionine-dependent homocysteine/selenocysteine methylase